MANNRLYIGNKETLETFCLTKSDGENQWRKVSSKELRGLNEILMTESIWQESTDLVIFSENDKKWYDYFFNNQEIKTPE